MQLMSPSPVVLAEQPTCEHAFLPYSKVTNNTEADYPCSTKVISVGITASVSVGITRSEAVSTTVQCPKSCDCGLQAVAHMWHIEGVHNTVHIGTQLPRGPMCPEEQNVATPYTADVPILIPGAAQNNQARVDFSPCRVPGTFCGPWGPPDKQWLPLCPSL